jgi:mRNA-degrading endonuclease RelE of RelBE toxin-antitoxin system
MDKITKLLKKLSQKEREAIETTLLALITGEIRSLDIKKLLGVVDVYRVRVGEIRIIFRKVGGEIKILEISRRAEDTYKKY